MKFSEYHFSEEILRSLEEMKWKRPTDIQYKVIPSILRGEDILAVAQTGTGKTGAFAIPIAHILQSMSTKKRNKSSGPQSLILVPTHELCLQTAKTFRNLVKYCKLKVLALIGGVEQDDQILQLKNGVDILITTPGRMFDLRSQGYVNLNNVKIMVIDEADLMLDKNFNKDIHDVKRYLASSVQSLMFTATIDKRIKRLAYAALKSNAIHIHVSPTIKIPKNIVHYAFEIDQNDKRFLLEHIVHIYGDQKTIVFVRTLVRAQRVKLFLDRVGIQATVIHREILQKERNKVIRKFREDAEDFSVLISTDVIARGIDLPEVRMVINYDMPTVGEQYVHRVGRTGRGNRKGKAISFNTKEESELLRSFEEEYILNIIKEKVDKTSIRDLSLSSEDYSVPLKDMMQEIEDLESKYYKKRKSKK